MRHSLQRLLLEISQCSTELVICWHALQYRCHCLDHASGDAMAVLLHPSAEKAAEEQVGMMKQRR